MSYRARNAALVLLSVLAGAPASHADAEAAIHIDIVAEPEGDSWTERAVQLLESNLPRVLDDARVTRETALPEGAVPDFTIYLGAAAAQWAPEDPPVDTGSAPRDGYWLRGLPNGWAAAGWEPAGTYFAVARHLQSAYGIRWYTPGELGAEYPAADDFHVPTGLLRESPAFADRWLLHRIEAEWSHRNGMRRDAAFNHNIQNLITPEVQADYPEFISTVSGRSAPTTGGRGAQPHYAAKGIATFVAERAETYFAQNPEAHTLSLSPTDTVLFDESPASLSQVEPFRYFRRRPNYTPLVFGFANRVAERLFAWTSQQGPVLSVLAYFWTEAPPEFAVHPHVMPWMTADRHQWFDPDFRQEDQRNVLRWGLTGARRLGTWDYYEGGPYVIPRHAPHLLADSIRFLHLAGVDGFFAEGVPIWGFDAPKLWVAAQLLWDPEQTTSALLNDFFHGYYRESAEPMRAFFGELEQIWLQQPPPGTWLKYWMWPSQLALFPPATCERLRGHLWEAERRSRSPRTWERVRRTVRTFDVTAAFSELYQLWAEAGAEPAPSEAQLQRLNAARGPAMALFRDSELLGSSLVGWLMRPRFGQRKHDLGTWQTRVELTFETPLIEGDAAGLESPGTPGVRGKSLDGSWDVLGIHSEGFRWHRREGGMTQGRVLLLEGQLLARLRRELSVKPGRCYALRVHARGHFTADARIEIGIRWLDANGARLGSSNVDTVPPGEHSWLPLTTIARAPEAATHARLSVAVQRQYPGDWLEIDHVRFSVEPGAERQPEASADRPDEHP